MAKGGKQPGAGRPKGSLGGNTKVAMAMREVFLETYRKNQAAINAAWLAKCLDGDMAAIKEANDRAWGKAPQALTTPEGDGLITGIVFLPFVNESDE